MSIKNHLIRYCYGKSKEIDNLFLKFDNVYKAHFKKKP